MAARRDGDYIPRLWIIEDFTEIFERQRHGVTCEVAKHIKAEVNVSASARLKPISAVKGIRGFPRSFFAVPSHLKPYRTVALSLSVACSKSLNLVYQLYDI